MGFGVAQSPYEIQNYHFYNTCGINIKCEDSMFEILRSYRFNDGL